MRGSLRKRKIKAGVQVLTAGGVDQQHVDSAYAAGSNDGVSG